MTDPNTELDTYQKLEDATFALQGWMKSQGFAPADGVMLAAWFVARLIRENATDEANVREKLLLHSSTVVSFLSVQSRAR